jgi:Zn-dependent protease
VTVTVSFWFFALLAVCVWLGADVLRLGLAAAVHEGGHLAALFLCGGRVRAVELGACGVRIRPRFSHVMSAREQAAMLLAGPAAGLAAALISDLGGKWRFAMLSAGLSIFNLLPVPGLDGGELLRLKMEGNCLSPRTKRRHLGNNAHGRPRQWQKKGAVIHNYDKKC